MTAERSTRHLDHDRSTRQVEPHDRVCPPPNGAVDHHRSVVPVDHPALGGRDRLHQSDELLRGDRLPAGQVMDRVEFDVRDGEDLGKASGEAGLTRACVPERSTPASRSQHRR